MKANPELGSTFEDLGSETFSRRRFLRAVGLAGASVPLASLLAACGANSGQQSGSAGPSVGLEEGPLVIFNWAQYLSGQNVKAFEKQFGVDVRVEFFTNNVEMLNTLRAGGSGYDLVVPGDFQIPDMIDSGLLLKLDKSKIPNIKNIDPAFLGQYWDPNNDYALPKNWGTNGYLYNTDVIQGDLLSWADFVTTAKAQSGKVTLIDSPDDLFPASLKATGHSINTTSESDYQDAEQWLLALKPYLLGLFPFGELRPVVLSGDSTLCLTGPADAVVLKTDNGIPVRYVYPSEGTLQFSDTWAIPKTGTRPNLAHAFINFINSPEAAAREVEYTLYPTVNKTALDQGLIDPTIAELLTPPADVMPNLEYQHPLSPDIRRLRDEIWTKFKAA